MQKCRICRICKYAKYVEYAKLAKAVNAWVLSAFGNLGGLHQNFQLSGCFLILKFSIWLFCIGVGHLAVLKTLPLKCSVRGVDGGQLRLPCSICSQISEPSSLHYHLRAQNIPPPENLATLFSSQEQVVLFCFGKLSQI